MSALIPVAAGSIAVVVTHLETTAPPTSHRPPPLPNLALVRIETPTVEWYLPLFRAIGEQWLWVSRLLMTTAQVQRVICAPTAAVYAVRDGTRDIGLIELNWHDGTDCEILFFGLVPDVIARGVGAWMMAETQRMAFAQGATRLWLHTCTADHPRALPFYLAQGFRAFKREVEIAPDPRLYNGLDTHAASVLPVIPPKA